MKAYLRLIKAYRGSIKAPIIDRLRHVEALRLLADRGADLHQAKNDGATPASIAARNGHAEALRLLADRGADR